MNGSERCQRSRLRGYKMIHPNGLGDHYVGRPGPYGNPFKLVGDIVFVDAKHRRQILDPYIFVCIGDAQLVQDLYRAVVTDDFSKIKHDISQATYDIKFWTNYFKTVDFSILKGKNLYCFCPLKSPDGSKFPCHADVLIEILNSSSV